MATEKNISELQQAILNVVAQIPAGKIATYGQIAAIAGAPGAARAVGRTMRSLPKGTQLPWHRVLNAAGKISIPHEGAKVQKARLESEGIIFLGGKASLEECLWRP